MSNQVYANMMEVSCKSGSGKTICAFPDVCFTPPQTPATPPGVPIPYPNTGMSSDTTDGSSTVKISGKEVMLKNKSYFKTSSGDEAGSAPKKGVITSKNAGKVYFNAWSMDVKIEGENVVRHLDITTHNHASTPGNSPPMPHTDAMQPAPPDGSSCPVGSSCNVGSPVNPVLGAKVLADDEDLDVTLPGPLALEWQRYYLSTNGDIGWFGRGWSSVLESRLEGIPDPTGSQVEQIEYVDYFGRRTLFDSLEPGASHFSPYDKLTLSRTAQGQYRLTTPDGLTRWFADRRETVYRLTSFTDRNGNAIHLDYRDAAAGTVYVDCSGGQRLELAFRDGRLVAITELRQAGAAIQRVVLVRYSFTGRGGDLWQVFNRANEVVRSFDYTPDRLMRRHVYGAFEAEYEYSGTVADAKVIRHWDNVGRSWAFTYHADHTAVTDQDGRVVLHHFDAKKRLIGITDPLGQVSRVGRDRYGNIRAEIDPAENVTETRFDERGNPTEVREPDGAVTTLDWHPELPLPLAVTDPLKRTSVFRYDARGNLVVEVDPSGAETRYLYDQRGQVAAVINANGGVTRRAYDDHGQLILHIDCSGSATRYNYDSNGWLVGEINALDERTSLVYDGAGRLIGQLLADGSQEAYENDIKGDLTAFIDGEQHRTEYRYAPDGLLVQRTDALGHSVLYRYDRARRLIELVNENQASYRFAYDALDRLTDEMRFDGTRVRWAYNRASHVIESIEAPGSPEQIVFRYTRDPMGRMLVRASDRTRAVFEYDAAGQRILGRTDNPPVTVEMAYDQAGRRTEERVTAGERSFAIRHTYDALDNQLSTTLPDGTELGTVYYGCGNVRQLSMGDELVTEFERDALHREVSRTQGALVSTRDYDLRGQMQRIQATAGQAAGITFPEIDRQFQYDRAGRLMLTREPGRQLVYGYDTIDRLTRFNEERFAFDPAHNLLPPNEPAGVVPDNRVMTAEIARCRYDGHGRVIEKRSGTDIVVSFNWNDDHHLVQSTLTDARGSRSTSYLYDAFGRRIAKRNDEGTTWYVWDRDRLLQEYCGGDEYTFLYEPDSFVPLAEAAATRGNSAPIPRSLYYFHCDQVGVPRELTDSQGGLAWAGEYRGWGRLWNEVLLDAAIPHPLLRLQGEYFDEETGLHYSLMRYYDPDFARFISKDPIGLLGGENEYQYGPNPVFWIDPEGLTGTYIFTDGTTSYVGKGPKSRFQASKRARLTGCASKEAHTDFGDDDMGFMVEHLLMVKYQARTSSKFANSPKLDSPGKKKYAAADAATKKKARSKRDALIKKFKASKCP